MAPADSTSSPRDHAADANPELARKKQRLSEDRGASPAGSIIIEVDDPEDIGATMDDAIEIEDGLDNTFGNYSDDFVVFSGDSESPLNCTRRLFEHIRGNFYMHFDDFVSLAQALHDHSELRLDESSEWRQHYLEDEAEFFYSLLALVIAMLQTGDLLNLRQKFHLGAVKIALCNLVSGLGALCRRTIPSLPDIIKTALSRRDSAHTSTRQHTVEALHYLELAAQVVCLDDAPALTSIARCYHPDDPDLAECRKSISQEFSTEQIVSSLAAVIRTLSGAMRDIKDSWPFLQKALLLFKTAVQSGHNTNSYPKADVESVMEIINACILPIIREKHPRALPDKFHELILSWGAEMLRQHVYLVDQRAAVTAYQLFISSPSDALIPEAVDEHSIADLLQQASGGNQENISKLFADSWVMQTAKTYLRSDIMDIRIIGLSALERRLVDIFHEHKSDDEGLEHPVIQHAVKFMRKNEIIPYVFGPESRAGLLTKSVDVVTFLAATSTYTDAETDVIWRACSTNVEADFVKASFDVLTKVKDFLDFERLLYIARKYSTSSINSFGVDALEFLPKLLQSIESKPSTERLAIGFVSIEILKSANCNSPCKTRDRLKHSALNEISRLASHPFSADDRLQVYKFCIPEILEQTDQATTSVEALNILLPHSPHSPEAESLLGLLPVNAAVDELCRFVERCKQRQVRSSDIAGIMERLDCVGRLIFLSSVKPESSIQEQLFRYLFGESAFSNQARDVAWQKLSKIAGSSTSSPVLRSLFQGYMKDHVASLPSDIATPGLIDLILQFLSNTLLKGEGETYEIRLLSHSLWKALVRFAITAPTESVITASVNAVLNLLFAPPTEGEAISAAAAARCQHEFVREHVACLSSLKDNFVAQRRPDDLRGFKIAMSILEHALSRSKQHLSNSKVPSEPDVLTLEGASEGAEAIEFIAQVYAIGTEPKLIKVQAKQSSRVSQLLARLPAFTSAAENRVIAGGVEVTDAPDRMLVEVGVQQSSVILIRPRFSFDVDLEKILSRPGPVEQAILSQYSILEDFLDGPYEVACSTRVLLEQIRLPAEARLRVVSSSSTANDLFPRDREQRAFFSLFILRAHLDDFASLGVADRDFILRATHLLTEFILDKEREFNPNLALDVLQKLCIVLRERPQNGQELQYFEKSSELSSRLVRLLFQAKSLPTSELPQTQLRNSLVAEIYSAVILAYKHSNAVWQSFTQDGAVVQLHGQILIDADVDFSDQVSKAIENVLHDEDISRECVEFYWQVLYPSLDDALSSSYLSESYFRLINKILDHLGSMDCQELWINQLVEELSSKVWAHKHLDSPPLLTSDRAMLGLLRLFSKAVGILKKKQKSSRLLAGLPSKLYRHFLFPSSDNPQLRPLVQEETRTIVYDLIKTTCTMQTDYDDLVAQSVDAVKGSVKLVNAVFPGMPEWIRPAHNASGLTNLGMTCYMNSLLQQLFGNLQFRKFILDQAIVNEERQATLAHVQQLFASMQDSIDPRTETARLATALNVQVGVQDDVHTFYTTLLSRLEESMPDRESKQRLNSFFTGKSVTQIRGDCGHVSSKEEPFTELSITVKNKASLHESLDEFVQGEPLEGANKYMCMNCGTANEGLLVNALRRTCLDSVPNGLTFCLKRFAFENILDGENKVNDRFEFPAEIDMSRYKRSHLEEPNDPSEPDMFELVGVIVHQGSLSYGHYWSYVRVPGAQNIYRFPWMILEDSKYLPCTQGIQEVQENCFGGLQWSDGSERADSAYVLFYQRKSYIADADRLNTVDKVYQRDHQVLPKINLPDSIQSTINGMNDWRVRIGVMFQDQFAEFIQWLLHRYPEAIQLRRNAISALEETDPERLELETADAELDARMGVLITTYILRIFVPEPHCEERIDQLIKSVTNVVRLKPAIATHICHCFTEDDFGFATIIRLGSAKVRSELLQFFFTCLMIMREDNPEGYERTAFSFITQHAGFLNNRIDYQHRSWREYFNIAAKFARTGIEETRTVLSCGYLQWILDVLFLLYDPKSKMRHTFLWKHCKTNFTDRTALYEFLHDLLDGLVDLSELPVDSDGPGRVQTARGWQLLEDEANRIVTRNPKADRSTALLIELGVHQCLKPSPSEWKEYAPGKLIGLLVGEKTHHMISETICDLMRIQIDVEEQELDPLLCMTLHILLQLPKVNGGLERCYGLMETLCNNIVLWHSRERRSLLFFREAFALTPGVVVRYFAKWADKFLVAQKQADRQLAAETLKETIFGPAPLQDESLEAFRIAGTRQFLTKCDKTLKPAYGRRENRALYEPMITAFRHASEYLLALGKAIEKRREEGGEIAPGVAVEYEETKTMATTAVRILEGFRDWKPATALPTRSIGVRQSVEIDDSEELDTDADGEDDFSEVSENDLP